MASTAPPQASLSNTPAQVIMVPARKPRVMRPVPGIKGMSIATIVLASICLLLGITAAVVKARMSFIVNPIWSAILFMLPCGILGVLVHKKKISFCMNISFLVMVILSAVASFQLCIFVIYAASDEREEDHGWSRGCLPYVNVESVPGYCTPQLSRILVDIAIAPCALAVGILNAISFLMTIYGTFGCCYTCCQVSTSTTAAYNAPTWIPMRVENLPQTMMSVPMQHQQSHAGQYTDMIVSPGVGSPQPSNQIPQPVYIMQPATNINPPQPQPCAVSNYQSSPPTCPRSSAGVQNALFVQLPDDEETRHTCKDETTSENCSKNHGNWKKF